MRVTRACRCRMWTVLSVILLLSFAAKPQGGAPRGGQWSIKPFHILGALYYVGLSDNTSFLFHTSQGDILLDPLNEFRQALGQRNATPPDANQA